MDLALANQKCGRRQPGTVELVNVSIVSWLLFRPGSRAVHA